MILAIAIDDEPPALNVVASFCENSGLVYLVKKFSRPDEALSFLKVNNVDLVFLDINMPSVSGLDLFSEVSKNSQVIFTTAHSQYAVVGFNLDAADYLLKPFTYDRFLQAVQKVIERIEYNSSKTEGNSVLLVPSGYTIVKVQFSNILYIQAFDDYLKIYLSNSMSPVVTRMTMKTMLDKIPAKDFIRIHRSFIVSVKKINKAGSKSIFMGDIEIPIGKSYADDFFAVFK